MKSRTERFDETFKVLLIVMTVTFSTGIAFYKEIMELQFFSISAVMFVIVIVLWAVSTLYGGKFEYSVKIIAWYFLMMTYGTIFARFYYTVFLLPPLVVSVVVIVCLALTLPILEYLKKAITKEDYNLLRKGLLFISPIFIILDVLYFLGLVTFPLF